jgi:hypothetical protein
MTQEEVTPIHPEAEEKRVVVDTDRQTLACYEGKREVYFAQVSTGMKYNFEASASIIGDALGTRPIWRKLFSST